MFSSSHSLKPLALACSLAIAGVLTGCSSGSDSTPAASTTLSGTAAAGAAIIGQVTVKGSLGMTKSAVIEADGSYNVSVTGLTAPYRLRAEGTVGGRTYKLHSYAEEADVGGNVNITPFTDLIIANAAGQIAETYFDSNTPADLDPLEVEAQESALQAKLQSVLTALGVDSAIDLLNSTFSANHDGLDAALDVVRIEVDDTTNIATITNLIENTTLEDAILDTEDNTEVLVVVDPSGLDAAQTDTQAIAAIFDNLTAAFANGLPTANAIRNYFSADFLDVDESRDQFLTEITTDPNVSGLEFVNASIELLTNTTAKVTVYTRINDILDTSDPIIWQAVKDPTLGWQLHGDRSIVDYWFSYHCNDYDGSDNVEGGCGINIGIEDNDFTNNGTLNNAPVASATASIIDGTDGTTVKGIVHLGTPSNANGGTAGGLQIYNADAGFQGDWKGFGSGIGDIAANTFAPGDTLLFDLYTEDLDISNASAPAITLNAASVFSFERPVLFAPETSGRFPEVTTTSLISMATFEMGNNLTIAWTGAAGTYNSELLVRVSDAQNNSFEIWTELNGSASDSVTISSSQLDSTAATSAGLDPNATEYELRIRVYTADTTTGNIHSTDYFNNIPGPAGAPAPDPALACSFESIWDDGTQEPAVFNSYDQFEEVVTACGGANTLTDADVIGTYVETWTDTAGTYVETLVFNANNTVDFTETLNDTVTETAVADWALANNRITMSSSTLGFIDVWAVTPQGIKVYTEEANWSSSPDLATLDASPEGEIWTSVYVKQP